MLHFHETRSKYTDSYLRRPTTVSTAVGPGLVHGYHRCGGRYRGYYRHGAHPANQAHVTVWGLGKWGKGLLVSVVKFGKTEVSKVTN